MADLREPVGVLFVCLGNICRSPLAEGIFLHKAARRGLADRFRVDSAGTGDWHVGKRPHEGSRAIAKRHGVSLPGRARQVTREDFDRFDHLICMDEDNLDRLALLGAPAGKLRLLLEVDPRAALREVPDPYFAGGFDRVYALIESACEALLNELAGPPDDRA